MIPELSHFPILAVVSQYLIFTVATQFYSQHDKFFVHKYLFEFSMDRQDSIIIKYGKEDQIL